MGSEQEIIHIGRQLERIANSSTPNDEQALDILKSLQGLPMTLDVLQKSRVGLSVNKLRKKCEGSELANVSKKLIKSWKKLLSGESPKESPVSHKHHPLHKSHSHQTPQQTSPQSSLPPSPPPVTYSASLKPSTDSTDGSADKPPLPNGGTPQSEGSVGASGLVITPSVSGDFRVPPSGDEVRDRCREMIAKALKKGHNQVSIDEEVKLYNLSAAIEECIISETRSTGEKYKKCVRSRVSNLGDLKNPEFRQSVICGDITPQRVATMSTEEMASNAMKQLRQKITKDAIRDAQMSTSGGTPTDLLKCSKCKKRNCTYTQAQTRSADEPMTTFAYCNECGYRWKFC